MAFIQTIDPTAAEGKLATIYQRVRGPGGQVDKVLQIHSLRPHTLEGHMALYKAVLHHQGNQLPLWLLESIGVKVSYLNGCVYCAQHHSRGFKRALGNQPGMFEAYTAQLQLDAPGAPFTTAERAALAYVRKLTLTPGSINQADIDGLRAEEFTDGQILEINQVASYFAYANRTVSGLGVTTEGEVLGLSPSDEETWEHE